MKKIKVLHVHTLPVISGSGINVLLTMDKLDKNKYEVEFACAPGGGLINEVLRRNIRFHSVRHFIQRASPYNDIVALAELIRIIKKNKYDIVHTHNSKSGFIGRLAAKISGVPVIIHTIHGFSFHSFERPFRRKLFIFLERIAAHWADKLIVISNPLREWGLSLGVGKPSQYSTIYSGIEIDNFKISIDIDKKKREFRIKANELVVGVVAKLWEGKGHRDMLRAAKEAVKKVPEVKFMFVGEGYLRKELEQFADSLGLNKHIIFTGFRTDIPEITSIFDVSVLASYFEGLGRVLLEAMVLGKPVVATRVGGIVDVVDDGRTGILVPPHNDKALAEAMIKLLLDKELREKMGERAKRKVDDRFSSVTMVNKIQQVYEELLTH